MKFVLSLVLVAYAATVVESIFLKEAMGEMEKLSSPNSYSAPRSYNAPAYEEERPVYVVKPESREYVTEVRKVKHVPVKRYRVYSRESDSDESRSRESIEYVERPSYRQSRNSY